MMRSTRSVEARFWEKVLVTDTCWLWTANAVPRGYGQLYVDGKMRKATRLVFEFFGRVVPAHLYVCHRCDNPRCVRPSHLFLGTAADNRRDMVLKGRGDALRGSQHRMAKLTEAQVQEIRASKSSRAELAASYGVSKVMISNIVQRKNWRHI